MESSSQQSYRHGLREAIGASAGPYGYTLTIWTSGAVIVHHEGLPTGLEAILFALGSIAAFALAGAFAFQMRPGPEEPARRAAHPVIWGSLHFVPILLAIGAASLIGNLSSGSSTWPAAGFCVTGIYLASVGGQILLVRRTGIGAE